MLSLVQEMLHNLFLIPYFVCATHISLYIISHLTLVLEITVLEIEYKTMHLNPDYAELDVKPYNSLPPIYELLLGMIRIDRLAKTKWKQISYIAATQVQKKK